MAFAVRLSHFWGDEEGRWKQGFMGHGWFGGGYKRGEMEVGGLKWFLGDRGGGYWGMYWRVVESTHCTGCKMELCQAMR